jgi:organic hydroperoxide reductase OsmC/OhrA
MPVRTKELRFKAAVERGGRATAEESVPLDAPEGWSAEHLLLTAVLRCSLTSLRFYARRRGAEAVGSGSARGVVTRRESDGRYAFVEVDVELEADVEPPPEDPAALVAEAERGCFIGSSLTVKPRYRWTINGTPVAAADA